jgi:hypothetical protein
MNPLPLHSEQVIVTGLSAICYPLFYQSEDTIFKQTGQENFHVLSTPNRNVVFFAWSHRAECSKVSNGKPLQMTPKPL